MNAQVPIQEGETEMKRRAGTIFCFLGALTLLLANPTFAVVSADCKQTALKVGNIAVGPFDLHRKYRSMEGPYVIYKFRIADLIASQKAEIPEDMITYVEGKEGLPGKAASMNGGASSTEQKAHGLVDKSGADRELLWFTGIKLIVLDENDKPMPTAEFICHLNVDVDLPFRQKVFPDTQHTGNARIMTLTQGQTEFNFPDGYAVPVASDEVWTFTFQAANRTSNEHRRLKHYCTVSFFRDSDLPADRKPKALHWYNPYIAVAIDKKDKEKLAHHGPSCMMTSAGDPAPNMVPGSTIRDVEGMELSGHWAVPAGVNHYETPITEQYNRGFAAQDRKIHAVWSHVHPMCTESSLVQCDGDHRTKVFSARISTKNVNGPEIEKIENVISKDGILLEGGKHYVLEATYDNKTKEELDSMVALGIFFADDKFAKPDWKKMEAASASSASQLVHSFGTSGVFCGIKGGSCENAPAAAAAPATSASAPVSAKNAADYGGSDRYPLFNPAKDGPVLREKKGLEIQTSSGPIHIELDPSLAPQAATQIYKYLTTGAFGGTTIYRYEPGFVLQTAACENKSPGLPPLPSSLSEKLRRLPLEVEAQKSGKVLHKKWALSVGHYTAPDSGISSFSIMLGDSPHLDGLYTIFGHLIPDEVTLGTVDKICENWNRDKLPYIISADEFVITKADGNRNAQLEAQK